MDMPTRGGAHAASRSPLYLLERFEVGVVHLDAERRVTGMNDFARRVLPVEERQPFARMVLDFHPERSRPKVGFLLDQAAVCPVASPPPMTMIINIPERVLLIKVTRIADAAHSPTGYVLVFYDITDVVSREAQSEPAAEGRRRGEPGHPPRRCRIGAAAAFGWSLHPRDQPRWAR
jgi:LytTR family transcriptional regulator, CO-responsive transcriptional regulator RcoM